MELLEILQNRRSIRSYTGESIPDDKLQNILQAGLLSASSRGRRPWELIVVKDKDMLKKMSACRAGSAKMLSEADAAVVVIADTKVSDVWTEDCSIVMSNMHLMADNLNIGSCWIQGRNREASDGKRTEEYLRELLDFPENFRLEAILSLGMPRMHPKMRTLEELPMEKIHREVF